MSRRKSNRTKTAPKTSAPKGKSKTKKQEQIVLIEELISVLNAQLKRLKRKNSSTRDEYRYNIDTDHMNWVFEQDGEEYKSFGFTSKDTTFGIKNMPLENNPKKGDTRKSYIRNGVVTGTKHSYSAKTAKNYQLTGNDKANAKSKARHYKKEQKKAKKN